MAFYDPASQSFTTFTANLEILLWLFFCNFDGTYLTFTAFADLNCLNDLTATILLFYRCKYLQLRP
jgi:hypothetical protein